MLQIITIDAADTLGEEDKLGSIEPGKFAEFPVLESNPYTVPATAIKDIHIWGTVHNGIKYPSSDIRA